MFGFQQFKLQASIMKLQIISLGFKMKTLIGYYHQLFYKNILEVFYCEPKFDLFPSCRNCQIDQFASWNLNRNAMVVDAFSISWSELKFYSFPPFSLIGAALAKVRRQQCWWIMIIPWQKTQFWFPGVITNEFSDTSSSKYTDFITQKINTTPTAFKN